MFKITKLTDSKGEMNIEHCVDNSLTGCCGTWCVTVCQVYCQ